MKIKKVYSFSVIVLAAALALAGCTAGQAGKVNVEGVWARPSRAAMDGSGTVTGAFMKLTNTGSGPDRLVSASCDAAEKVEIHETVMEGEVAKMQPLPDGLELPAGGSVELKPGGYHIMLINLKNDLKAGDKFMLDLQFEKAGKISVEAMVEDPAASMP